MPTAAAYDPSGTERPAADAAAVAAAKALLRKAIGFRRDSRSADQRQADDTARLRVLESTFGDHVPQRVAAYLSTGSEPSTLQLVAWLAARDVDVLLPVLTDGDGAARREPAWAAYAGPDALRVGQHGIVEPTGRAYDDSVLGRAQLVICPGLAANVAGDRLGRGGGWYDRALQRKSPGTPVWVLLNDDEVLGAIPTDHWDLGVDAIATPRRFVRCDR